MKNNKYVYGFMALATLAILATGVPALAQTTTPSGTPPAWANHGVGNGANRMMKPGVFGTVSAVSGNIITVTSTRPTTTTYTVDATNAKITKK